MMEVHHSIRVAAAKREQLDQREQELVEPRRQMQIAMHEVMRDRTVGEKLRSTGHASAASHCPSSEHEEQRGQQERREQRHHAPPHRHAQQVAAQVIERGKRGHGSPREKARLTLLRAHGTGWTGCAGGRRERQAQLRRAGRRREPLGAQRHPPPQSRSAVADGPQPLPRLRRDRGLGPRRIRLRARRRRLRAPSARSRAGRRKNSTSATSARAARRSPG